MDEEVQNEPVKILTEIRAILAMWVLRALAQDLELAFQSEPSIKFGRSSITGKIEYLLCDSLESLVFAFSKIQNLLIEKSFNYESSSIGKPDEICLSKATGENDPTCQTKVTINLLDKIPSNEEKSEYSCHASDTACDCDSSSLVFQNEARVILNKSSPNENAWSGNENTSSNNVTGNDLVTTLERSEVLNNGNSTTSQEELDDCSDSSNIQLVEPEDNTSSHPSNVTSARCNLAADAKSQLGLRRSTRKRLANARYSFGVKNTVFEGGEDTDEDGQGHDCNLRKNYEQEMPYKYFCEQCSFKTKRISHLEKHTAIHKKVKTLYSCGQCSFTSMRLGHLRRHESSHSTVLHKCDKCSYFTDDMKLLIRHRKQKHQSYRNSKDGRLLNCKECAYETPRQHLFDRHKRIHCVHNHQCTMCPYRTWRKEHYVRHVNNVHKNKRPYLCHLCGKAFKRGDSLRHHHTVFHISDPSSSCTFTCEVCGKSFRTHSHLDEHRAVHSNVRSFLCEICGSSFKTRSVQRKHIQTIHENPRSKSCVHCDKKFNTVFALRRHLKVHNHKKSISNVENVESAEHEQNVLISEASVTNETSAHFVALNEEDKINIISEENKISVLTLAPSLQTDGDAIQETVLASELIGTLQPPSTLQSTEITSALFLLTSTTII